TNVAANAMSAAERSGIHKAENFDQRADAALQRAFEQLAFGGDEPMLFEGGLERASEHFAGAGFGQELEDFSFIDRGHGRAQVGIAGEHDTDGIGRALTYTGQEL